MSAHAFGAYVISYMPSEKNHRADRLRDLAEMLNWWIIKTSIPLTLIASGWTDADFGALGSVGTSRRVSIVNVPAQPVAVNRVVAFQALYASDNDWGIMLDDDAILYDSPQHNRGPAMFSEMASNGIDAYEGVDLFFPINPQKIGFTPIYAKDPALYVAHHVFERSIDLKGSMFVVRNFRKEGKREVLPDASFSHVGEDRQIALEAVSMGYSVMRCENIILKEFSGHSHFAADRTAAMATGYTALAQTYASDGLKMKAGSHQHDLKEFWRRCWKDKPTQIVV